MGSSVSSSLAPYCPFPVPIPTSQQVTCQGVFNYNYLMIEGNLNY